MPIKSAEGAGAGPAIDSRPLRYDKGTLRAGGAVDAMAIDASGTSWEIRNMIPQLLFAASLFMLTPGVFGQAQPGAPADRPDRPERRFRPDDDDRGPRFTEEDRQRMREWRQRYRSASAEEREQMRADRWVMRATRMYELDETQQQLVRTEIVTMQNERQLAMGPDAEKYNRLREQMERYWIRDDDQPPDDPQAWRERRRAMRDDPQLREIREQMREIEERHPFDIQAAIQRIESRLPAEQVQKGQARREDWMSRRAERDQRRGERGDRRRDPGDPDRRPPSADAGVSDFEAARRARDEAEAQLRRSEQDAKAQAEKAAAEAEQAARQASEAMHPWEKCVRQFIAEHDLTNDQSNAAMAILKDVRARADRQDRLLAAQIAAAAKRTDAAGLEQRPAQQKASEEQLFTELKKRLETLLTASQRAKTKITLPIQA